MGADRINDARRLHPARDAWSNAGTVRVLLIDDEDDVRFMLSMALKAEGHAPVAFGDCDAAIEVLREPHDPFAAVLLDLNVDAGTVGAREFVAWLRDNGFGAVPVVFVSGEEDVNAIARDEGVAGALRKPITLAALGDALERVVAR